MNTTAEAEEKSRPTPAAVMESSATRMVGSDLNLETARRRPSE
eukprot:CAMPEP_0175078536 /NCGR_PEP_ID=MMETSP0052_2-20121109/24193_1 /TAXON_ID=51329 ORGANISM="Polytomella parva, Strain SAG 63-3" /NCGR_SAMPLE_ID=MMETSP0052_2 /ASSEMBLY_ACC=CAM_ASM_000194 /LENGTH=42 /DNA_ID= /DNA_START= /DNA_END= /DNA_ORIENTATION=